MSNQGNLVELVITDVNHNGEGVGRLDGQVVFVPNTVTGDRIQARLTHCKKEYAYGQLHQLLVSSPYRQNPRCIVADKCGGCQLQHIDYAYQKEIKRNLVIQALQRIGGFAQPDVALVLSPIPELGYRNKATYPLQVSATTGEIQAGYYRHGTHKLINLNQCPVQDVRLNPLLSEVKKDLQQRGWTIYIEEIHRGQLRHLSLRIGRHTQEMLLTLVTTDLKLPKIEEQAMLWLNRYPNLVGVALNYQPAHNNVIFGEETVIVAGRGYLREIFAGVELHLRPETFFQVNTETAEAVLRLIEEQLQLQGNELLVDAYCGVGTFTLPLAKKVHQAIGIESYPVSVTQAQLNAQLNQIKNVSFLQGLTEQVLPQLTLSPDIVILDPPRKGCDRQVLSRILEIKPSRVVYVSCQPATLARDLKILCEQGAYRLIKVYPADFFPQTNHIESVAFLEYNNLL